MSDINKNYIAAKEKAARIKAGKLQKTLAPSQRIPPGQRVVEHMVAMAPITFTYPVISRDAWRIRAYGEVEKEEEWNWEEFINLKEEEKMVDFHCVTAWSKLGQHFTGVDFKKIVAQVKPKPNVRYVIFECYDGYTTNLVYEELLHRVCFIATKMDGADIPPKYGGPARVVVPHLYGWKSAKFVKAIRFSDKDEPGFWETRGYHNHANPWQEERYSSE